MRVAFISVHTCPLAPLGQKDTGGMNVYLREAARELGRRGICVDVYTRRHTHPPHASDAFQPQIETLGENARVVHLDCGPWDAPKQHLHRYLGEFSRDLDQFLGTFGLTYDLVHSHYWLSGQVALRLKRERGVTVVASFHTLGKVQRLYRLERDSTHRDLAEWRVAQEADRIVAGSPDERRYILRMYGASAETTHVVPCGYDERLFRPHNRHEARRELGLTGSRIVLFVGRMDRIKGVDVLLKAAAALEDKKGLQVVVVGGAQSDAEVARLRVMAKDLRIEGHALFAGSVPQASLPLYYSAADVCVVPSYYETFGLVAVESMACGTPVIAARVGGLKATIADGKTGYLVPWHCPEPYAERLETVLGNPVLREGMGKAALESVQGLTWSRVADSLLDVYGLAVGQNRRTLEMVPCDG